MEFATAKEYRRYLRTVIDDPGVVELAVHVKFPVKSRTIGLEQFKKTGKKAPSKFDPWIGSEAADRIARDNIKLGSHQLLKAIWRDHSGILQHMAGQGLTVVQP